MCPKCNQPGRVGRKILEMAIRPLLLNAANYGKLVAPVLRRGAQPLGRCRERAGSTEELEEDGRKSQTQAAVYYEQEVVPQLMESCDDDNIMRVPRVVKTCSTWAWAKPSRTQVLDSAAEELTQIRARRP